jgi:[ribosomal protein S5]-alanine N-acetyltransferase
MTQPLATARLRLVPANPLLAGRVAAFFERNAAHLAPWEPRRAQLTDPFAQQLHLEQLAKAFADGSGWRWLLLAAGDDSRVIGSVAVNNIVRGYFQSGNLGYALDGSLQGQGLMQEAVEAVMAHLFSPEVALHRLQAACRPENHRSLALLARMGFRTIGLAERYLCIDGEWRDHLLCERVRVAEPPN